jgi:DNA-binding MarR family transcriptional regulator
MPTAAHEALLHAIEDLARAQREAGVWLSRVLECNRGALAVVRALGAGPLQVGELAQGLRVDVSVASRQVAALVDAGLVDRDVTPADRRVRTVGLTDAGRAMLDRSADAALDLASVVFADWSDQEIEAAAEQVRKVATAVTTHPRAGGPAHPAATAVTHEREIA